MILCANMAISMLVLFPGLSALLEGLPSLLRSLYSQVNKLAAKSKMFQMIKRGFLILILEKNLNVLYLPGKFISKTSILSLFAW